MAFSLQNLLELAKNSDAEAIRILINRSLEPKGITVIYSHIKNRHLEIILEFHQTLDSKKIASFIQTGMLKLGAKEIDKVIIYGQKVGEMLPSWSEEVQVVADTSLTTQSQKIQPVVEKHIYQTVVSSLQIKSSQCEEWKAYSLTGHSGIIYSIALSSNSNILVSSSQDKTVKLWDMRTGNEIPGYMYHLDLVYCVAISQDGELIASGSADGVINIWRRKQDLLALPQFDSSFKHSGAVHSLAISSNKKTLISSGANSTIKIWDLELNKEIFTFLGHSGCVWSVAISPDNKTAASGSGDNTIKIWDINTGKLIHTFLGHSNAVNSVTFSPDGKILASGSLDRTVKIWDLVNASLVKTLPSCATNITSVAFSPDGKTLASTTGNNAVQTWDVSNGQLINEINEHSLDNWSGGLMTGLIASLGFTPSTVIFSSDGYTLISTALTKIKIWQHYTIYKPLIISSSPDILESAVAMDYSRLRDLLASGKWSEADLETKSILLKVSECTMAGWITVEHIKNFPSEDLSTIDRLWTKYSNGHFGFSVQKRIWQSLGGKPRAKYKVYDKFGDCLGWRVKGQWLDKSQHKFTLTAPAGHLPLLTPPGIFCSLVGAFLTGLLGGSLGMWSNAITSLYSREEL